MHPNSPASRHYVLHPLFYAVVMPALLFFVIAAWSPPLMYQTIPEWFGSWQKNLFSFVCHQQLDRIFHFGEVPMAVCSRCAGIYTGLAAALPIFLLFSAFVIRSKHYIVRIFLIVSVVVVVDGGANIVAFWHTPNYPRSLTGLLWGVSAGSMLAVALLISSKTKK